MFLLHNNLKQVHVINKLVGHRIYLLTVLSELLLCAAFNSTILKRFMSMVGWYDLMSPRTCVNMTLIAPEAYPAMLHGASRRHCSKVRPSTVGSTMSHTARAEASSLSNSFCFRTLSWFNAWIFCILATSCFSASWSYQVTVLCSSARSV